MSPPFPKHAVSYEFAEMTTICTENRKLSAWIGSILFHTVLFFLVLLWFSFSTGSDRTSPGGERTAIGSILLQPSGGSQQQAETTQADQQNADPASATAEWEQFSKIDLNVSPVTPVLAPGPNQNVPSTGGAASASGLAQSLQHEIPGNPGIGNQTGEATVRFFGLGGKGTKFMYVLDRSTSMEGAPIRAAKAELTRSLESLDERHQFNIIFYSGDRTGQLWEPGRKLVYATESNKQRAARHIATITPDGGTRHYEPLLEAIAHRPDVIFFLTDGESKDDLTPVQLSEIEKRNNAPGRRGSQINVIQFGRGGLTDSPSRSLQQLAEQNFGEYLYFNVQGLR